MIPALTLGFTWTTCFRGALTSASTPSTACCLPSVAVTPMASRPPLSATCPPPTSGRWKPLWMSLAAATPAPSSTAKSSYQEATSTTPTPGPCARTTPPPTPGRIRAAWAHLEAGTAPPPLETGPTSLVVVSWVVVVRGWMSSLLSLTILTMGSGATAHLFTREWARLVFPFQIIRCISWEAGTRVRRSTRNAFRCLTPTWMNGLKMTSCQRRQSAFRAASSPCQHGKLGSPELVQCPLHQSVYRSHTI